MRLLIVEYMYLFLLFLFKEMALQISRGKFLQRDGIEVEESIHIVTLRGCSTAPPCITAPKQTSIDKPEYSNFWKLYLTILQVRTVTYFSLQSYLPKDRRDTF